MSDAAPPRSNRLLILAGIGVIAIALAVAASRCASAPVETVTAIGDTGERIVGKFMTGRIETTYREYLASASPTGELDVAKVEQTEEFERKDERRILWDHLSLGQTSTAIKTTATFRYHVSLRDERWHAEVHEHTLFVVAPPLEATVPTAFQTDHVEERSERGWARFNRDEQMGELRRSITPALDLRARDPEHLAAAREPARIAVGEFVKNWLAKEQQWSQSRFSAVSVRFADEPPREKPSVLLE